MAVRRKVMLIVETSSSYGREVLRGINRYVIAREPWSMYLEQRELMAEPPAWLDNWKGDGIISRSTTSELARKLARMKIAKVDLTDVRENSRLPHVWTDHRAVGQMAAVHLRERGFRHLGFCGFSGHTWSQHRCEGFLAEAGDPKSCAIYESPWGTTKQHSWEQQQEEIANWLASLPKPAGVMACNDVRGLHVLDACRRIEVAVPEEVAVIGVDNDELLCDLCDPPLSSVALNPQRVGYEAAQMLDAMMGGRQETPHEVVLPPVGVVTRQSTDTLAINDPLIASAVQYIREGACRGITIDQLLLKVPLSRSMLERRFRKYLRRSPQEEIRMVQLKRVKQLLAETDLVLEEIAELAGYKHAEYMSVVFKREIGRTPGQYRATTHLAQ